MPLTTTVTNSPGQLSLAITSWVEAMSTSQRAVMRCGWGVKQVQFIIIIIMNILKWPK